MNEYQFNTKKILIYTLIIVVVILGYYYNSFSKIDNYIYDTYQKIEYLSDIEEVNSDVTIIEINDLTTKKLGDWPINRSYYVEGIEKLNNDGANVIVFDILFDNARTAQADSLMIDRLRENKNIVMPVSIDYSVNQISQRKKEYNVNSVNTPISSFMNLVKLGHTNIISDKDGTIRSLPPLFIDRNTTYLPIGRRAAELALEEEISITEGEYLVNYLGPAGTIPKISLHDYLNDNYNSEFIKDNIILLGVTKKNQSQNYPSIFSPDSSISKIQLLGQMTNNYLHQTFIKVNSSWQTIIIAFILLWLAFYLFERYNPYRSLIALIVLSVIILSLNYYVTIYHYLFTEVSVYLIGIFILYIISLISWFGFRRKEKFEIVDKLKPYFSPYLIKKIVDKPEMLKLKGDKTPATLILFEFENFNRYSQESTPKKVIEDLNHFYENISKIIFKYDGVIDKYLGDGLLAYWNKDFGQDNHRNRAVKAAIEIMNYLEKERIELKPSIVVNTGKIILGDIGTNKRMEFKTMGQVVHNTMELGEVSGPEEILIGENTYYGLAEIYKKLNWKYKEIDIEGVEKSLVVFSLKEFKSLDKGE
ncbi:MAG: adenylate/guanylate cyclase domain-containing protein [Halanaerobiales bacterium]|nr:adenylate/guanylate cyclase domain-containing protein [Halanaerobiales bacterium]